MKINGEQNRVLLENVRPSYYREKSELHPLAYYDDAARGNTVRFKSVNSNVLSFSSTSNSPLEDVSVVQPPQSKVKEDPLVATLKKAIGEEAFGRVRDIFEHYSAYSGRMHYMDSYEYNKFMKENGFYTEQTPKIKIDLLFARNNKARESKNCATVVAFPKLVQILYEVARLRSPEAEDNVAVNELLKATLFRRQNANYQEKSKFEDWFIELEKPSVIDYLNSQSSFFLAVTLPAQLL